MITVKNCPIPILSAARGALRDDPSIEVLAKTNHFENFAQATAMVVLHAMLDVMDPNSEQDAAILNEITEQAVTERWYGRAVSFDWAKVPLIRSMLRDTWNYARIDRETTSIDTTMSVAR